MSEQKPKRGLRRVLRVIAALLTLAVLAYCGLIGMVYYREIHVPVPSDYDSIIVLGAQVLPDGSPSVQLRWRLDKAREMYDASPCPIVLCGAQAGQEPAPEGEIMHGLLLSEGVPESDLHAECESTDTKENMRNAKAILDPLGCDRPLIVTSDYHLPRALQIAEDAGLHPQGVGSPCRPELGYWLKNHCREALAWGKYWLVKYTGLRL